MIKLSILMPYHNESFEKIKPTFESLHSQKGVDFKEIELVISNNCEKPKEPIEIYESFPNLNINYVLCKEIDNIGMSRQTALDNAKGEYVCWLDSDDIFPDNTILNKYFQIMNQHKNFDIIYCKDCEQTLIGDELKTFLLAKSSRDVFVSGKLYKKEFIVKNKITFIPIVSYSEDTLFNLNCLIHHPILGEADFLSYIHCYNPKSTSRQNTAAFTEDATRDFIKGILWLVDQYKDSEDKEYIFNIIQLIFNDFVFRIEDKFKVPVRKIANEYYLKRLLNME